MLAALVVLRLITPVWTGGYDARFYRAMSESFLADSAPARTAPYCWRLLPATLIALLPLPTDTAWHLFNWAALFLAALLLFDLLRAESGSLAGAALGTFFFLFSWVNARFILLYPHQSDSAYYLVLALAFWSLARKKDLLFFVSLCLGALTREYFIALIPAYYFNRKQSSGLRHGARPGRTLLPAFAPLAIFLSVRLLIRPSNPDFSYFGHGAEFGRLFLLHWRRTVYSFANVYGAALFVIAVHLPSCLRYLKNRPGFAVYIPAWFFFLAIGGADIDRINFIGFPIVALAVAAAVGANRRLYANKLLLAFLTVSHLVLMRVFAPMGPENWRKIWWSWISFMPEEIFRSQAALFVVLLAAFLLLAGGVRLVKTRNQPR